MGMEIPSANIYKNSTEEIKELDFLNKDLKVFFNIEKEALEFLPEVTDEEMESGKEKYRILLGNFTQNKGGEVEISIKGILEEEGEFKNNFYREGIEEIVDININNIKKRAKEVSKSYPEFADWELVGEIHTHPVTAGELSEGQNAYDLSQGDFDSVVTEYKNGNLSEDKPFLFGVAGRDASGRMIYKFYRMVKEADKYLVQEIESSIRENQTKK